MPTTIKEINGVPRGGRLNWLHTCHGPWPTLACEINTGGEVFIAAAWYRKKFGRVIVIVDGPDQYHGGISLSYFWRTREEPGIYLCATDKKVDQILRKRAPMCRNELIRIIRSSIELYITY